jgi:hypothetical protein
VRRSISLAPFALSSDGRVVVNTAALDGPITPKALLERALREPGRLFVGVELSSVEVAAVMSRAREVLDEAAAYAAGARRRRRQGG